MTIAITRNDLFLMVNIRGHSSGLPMNIWIGPRGHARHAARIKVQMDHRVTFDLNKLAIVNLDGDLVTGELSSTDLTLVRRYLLLNREAILEHWNELTDGVELTRALKPLVR